MLVKGVFFVSALMGGNTTIASSYSQTNVNINNLGTHGGLVFYTSLEGGQQGGCSLLYCPAPSDTCDRLYSLALAARISDATLAEVRYDKDDATNFCTVTLISL